MAGRSKGGVSNIRGASDRLLELEAAPRINVEEISAPGQCVPGEWPAWFHGSSDVSGVGMAGKPVKLATFPVVFEISR